MKQFESGLSLLLVGFLVIGVAGCASYEPEPMERTGPPVGTMDEKSGPGADFSSEQDPEVPRDDQTTPMTLSELENRETVEAERTDDVIILTLDSRVLFDLGSARVNREAWPILDDVTKYLATQDEHWILVAGHTDALPTRTRKFPSNWDLSAQRSVNVIKYMSHLESLDETSLIAAGMAEHHPIASNQTEEGRERNRRVEIFILKDDFPPGEYRQQ
jgi:flagellar motor protein MotB